MWAYLVQSHIPTLLKMVVVVWKIWWWSSQLFLPAGDACKNLVSAIVVAHLRLIPAWFQHFINSAVGVEAGLNLPGRCDRTW
jgi:hypothetical protein